MNTKTQNALIVATTSIATIAALGLSNAQTPSSTTSSSNSTTSNSATSTEKTQKQFGDERWMRWEKGMGWMGNFWDFGWNRWWKWMNVLSDSAKTALTNWDYNAFKTAVASDSRLSNITQEQFNEMATREKKMLAIQAAIKANDYQAYVKATTPTQDEFNKLVARENSKIAIENAIKANDYNAFLTAWKLDTSRPADITAPTQQMFSKIVEKYNKKSQK